MTTFRVLRKVSYRRSYNHNGQFYTRHDPGRYDRFGLWSHGDIHFSTEGSAKETVRRMVEEAEAGATHRELADRLRVRVYNALLGLFRKGQVDRERMEPGYVYFHAIATVRDSQWQRRREQIEAASAGVPEVDDALVIEVLLVLIRHPGLDSGDVVRRLRGRSPPIGVEQVRAVFSRYDLDKKGGPSTC